MIELNRMPDLIKSLMEFDILAKKSPIRI
jgi:hypothetical protein